MLTFCSACEVPKGDTCRGDIDKAGQSKSVLLSAGLEVQCRASLELNTGLEEVTVSLPLTDLEAQ